MNESELGHSRLLGRDLATSALPGSVDIHQVSRYFSKVPNSEVALLDHLICSRQ
jgi:hypothetical protein